MTSSVIKIAIQRSHDSLRVATTYDNLRHFPVPFLPSPFGFPRVKALHSSLRLLNANSAVRSQVLNGLADLLLLLFLQFLPVFVLCWDSGDGRFGLVSLSLAHVVAYGCFAHSLAEHHSLCAQAMNEYFCGTDHDFETKITTCTEARHARQSANRGAPAELCWFSGTSWGTLARA